MGNDTVFEEVLETGGSKAKQAGKSTIGAISDAGKAAASQIAGVRDKNTQDVVKELYGKTDQNTDSASDKSVNQNSQQPEDNTPQGIEKKKKLEELRQQLHREVYYDPLVNLPKQKEEEKPAEKIEREKMQEMQDLQKKEKDKPPPLIQKTQQGVEKYPGAGG